MQFIFSPYIIVTLSAAFSYVIILFISNEFKLYRYNKLIYYTQIAIIFLAFLLISVFITIPLFTSLEISNSNSSIIIELPNFLFNDSINNLDIVNVMPEKGPKNVIIESNPQDPNNPKVIFTTDVKTINQLSNALQDIGSNVGLGTAIGGTAGAAATVLKGSGLNPHIKVGLICAAGAAGGAVFTGASILNKLDRTSNNMDNNSMPTTPNPESRPSSPTPDAWDIIEAGDHFPNDIDIFLSSILILQVCILIFTLYLILYLFIKYLTLNYNSENFNFFDKFFQKDVSNKLNLITIKLINNSKKLNNVFIFLILILLLISILSNIYFILQLKINFQFFAELYLHYLNNK